MTIEQLMHENAWKELIISFPGLFSACSMGREGLILPMALHPSIRFAALAFNYVRYALLHTWRPSSFLSRFTHWRQVKYIITLLFLSRDFWSDFFVDIPRV